MAAPGLVRAELQLREDSRRFGGPGVRLLAPEARDQRVERERLVRVQQEQRKQSPLPGAGELERPARPPDRQGAEDPELEFSLRVRRR